MVSRVFASGTGNIGSATLILAARKACTERSSMLGGAASARWMPGAPPLPPAPLLEEAWSPPPHAVTASVEIESTSKRLRRMVAPSADIDRSGGADGRDLGPLAAGREDRMEDDRKRRAAKLLNGS